MTKSKATSPTNNSKSTVQPLVLSPESISDHEPQSFTDQGHGSGLTWQTIISAPQTATNNFTSGIATCAPETGRLSHHRHSQAEIYHFISEIEGSQHPVRAGSIVFIPGDAEHAVQADSNETEELKWLYVFATDGFEDVVYRWPGEEGYIGPAKSKL
ncbi:hypothetical protein LTR37_005200 [Vermiconidia calcicola]|uniref:Uncharacterized protein n=1 Tax=Vermiconidia calcicola TaxID=1690605 RepID=A0ACC3NLT7_9PEZI|nr:hypothetical protein LTR37_005200 [Vermiconidia calcicola]